MSVAVITLPDYLDLANTATDEWKAYLVAVDSRLDLLRDPASTALQLAAARVRESRAFQRFTDAFNNLLKGLPA